MENKVFLKKYIIIFLGLFTSLLAIFIIINIYEYNRYKINYNKKINNIVEYISLEYPNINKNEIINILNSKNEDNDILKQYGIDIYKESVILENEEYYHIFLIVNIIFFSISLSLVLIIFLLYNKKKDKQINDITRYIERINNNDYSLSIDDISEDELSILKNEIYKTTIMLKENAINSKEEKKKLKKSLEDISHQLKTPLTSMLIIVDNLIDDPNMEPNTKEEFIKDIKKEILNINFLVQSLLKISKLNSNTVTFKKDKYLIKNIINESIENVSILSELKNIDILFNSNDITLLCDYRWEVEAITNIIKNCIEHSSNNSKINIDIKTNKVYTSIIIKDNGKGINKKDLPHIFERFYKCQNSNSDSIGIGLHLAKTIIEEDSGTITVKSDEKGTTFIIKYYKNL